MLFILPCFFFLIAGPQRWKGCDSIHYREEETTYNFYFSYSCGYRFFARQCFASIFSCSCAGSFSQLLLFIHTEFPSIRLSLDEELFLGCVFWSPDGLAGMLFIALNGSAEYKLGNYFGIVSSWYVSVITCMVLVASICFCLFVVSAVHFAPYLTGLSNWTLSCRVISLADSTIVLAGHWCWIFFVSVLEVYMVVAIVVLWCKEL